MVYTTYNLDGLLWPWPMTPQNLIMSLVGACEYSQSVLLKLFNCWTKTFVQKNSKNCSSQSWDIAVTVSDRTNEQVWQPKNIMSSLALLSGKAITKTEFMRGLYVWCYSMYGWFVPTGTLSNYGTQLSTGNGVDWSLHQTIFSIDTKTKTLCFSVVTLSHSFIRPVRYCYRDISWMAWTILIKLTANILKPLLIPCWGSKVKVTTFYRQQCVNRKIVWCTLQSKGTFTTQNDPLLCHEIQ